MTKILSTPPEHHDKLGRMIEIDDFVTYPSHNTLMIGRVVKINNKMIRVVKVPAGKYHDPGKNKYPGDLIKIDPRDVTVYLLKNQPG